MASADVREGETTHVVLGAPPAAPVTLTVDQINQTLKFRKKRMNHLLHEAEEMVNHATKRQIDLFHKKEEKRLQFLAC